ALHALDQRALDLILESRVRVDDVPVQRHRQPPCPPNSFTAQTRNMSSSQRMMPTTTTTTITYSVVCTVSVRVGHTTLRTSVRGVTRKSHAARPTDGRVASTPANATMPNTPATRYAIGWSAK